MSITDYVVVFNYLDGVQYLSRPMSLDKCHEFIFNNFVLKDFSILSLRSLDICHTDGTIFKQVYLNSSAVALNG